MFRPAKITHPVVVNDGKPFDAYRAEVYRYGRGVYLSLRTQMYVNKCLITIGVPKNGVFSYKDDHIHRCVSVLQYQLAQALNPPIKVTQAVLKAMEKVPEAKFILLEGNTRYFLKWDSDRSLFHIMASVPVSIGDYIQADDCPLALQVLLGFTTKGVPKDE
jgi:hypothetical protein